MIQQGNRKKLCGLKRAEMILALLVVIDRSYQLILNVKDLSFCMSLATISPRIGRMILLGKLLFNGTEHPIDPKEKPGKEKAGLHLLFT